MTQQPIGEVQAEVEYRAETETATMTIRLDDFGTLTLALKPNLLNDDDPKAEGRVDTLVRVLESAEDLFGQAFDALVDAAEAAGQEDQ